MNRSSDLAKGAKQCVTVSTIVVILYVNSRQYYSKIKIIVIILMI